MAVKRKSKEPVKVSLPRRSKRSSKFKTRQSLIYFAPRRTSKNTTHISDLPNEVLLHIFSSFSTTELFFNIRPVCRRFKLLAMSPTLWREISIQNEVSTSVLSSWIKSAPLLKTFTMTNRNDTNVITEELSKCCKHLESIRVQNCWGSSKSCFIHSIPLCNLVTRCPNLYNFNFSQSSINRFMSRKFFRLISRDKRSGKIMKKCNYIGPMTAKQMRALFSALRDYEVHDTATIGNVNFNQKFKLRDIIRYFQDLQNPRQIINEVWENLNYGPNIHEVAEDNPVQVDV